MALLDLGVTPERIRVLLNKVDPRESVEKEFAALFALAAQRRLKLRPQAAMFHNEVFEQLKEVGRSLAEVSADPVDYRARLRELSHPDDKSLCVRMVLIKRLAASANENLDVAFKALFAK